MAYETYMIKVKENVTCHQVQSIFKVILGLGGRIEMVAGKIIIASFESSYSELVKKTPGVELAGGINFKGRKILKIVKRVSTEKQGDF